MSASQPVVDPFRARKTLPLRSQSVGIYSLRRLEELGLTKIARLPFSIRVLLESVLRNCDGLAVTEEDVRPPGPLERRRQDRRRRVPFKPARVVLQDFTGVPAVVDLAAMRSAVQRLGGRPETRKPP